MISLNVIRTEDVAQLVIIFVRMSVRKISLGKSIEIDGIKILSKGC
jgi:hypothetical protein